MKPPEQDRTVELRMHQAVAVATVVALPVMSWLYDRLHPSQIDPPVFRVLFVGLAGVLLVGSLVSAAFRRWMREAVFVVALLMVLWVVWLAVVNQFTTPRVLGVLLVHLCIGQLFVSSRWNVILHAVVVSSLAVGSVYSPPPHEVPPVVVTVIAGTIGVFGVAVAIRQERLIAQLELARDHLEERVAERTQELRDANRAKSSFLTNMSHELRTPLNAVIGYSELMKEELREHGTVHGPDLDRVLTASRHLLAMINDLLDLAKIEAGAWTPSFEPVELPGVVGEAVTTVLPLANSNGNSVITRVESDLAPLWVDRKAVLQLLVNLLSNAAKFTKMGEITVSVRREDQEVVLDVADTGPGIPSDRLHTVFDKFVQLQDASTRRHPGTGLGLSISSELAQRLGGRVDVRSQVGVGSTFTIRLPWRDLPGPEARGGPAPSA